MPIVSRKGLRQKLGQSYLQAATFGTSAIAVAVGSVVCVMDPNLANPDFTNQNLYTRSHLRAGSADYRIGSFNIFSGGLVSAQLTRFALASGGDFEVYDRWSASDLDRCIDQTIAEIRVNQEVTFPSIDRAVQYSVAGVASPNTITDFNDVYYYAAPDSSVNRQRGDFSNVNFIQTASGPEFRVDPPTFGGSVAIAIDAILELSLGTADTSTINVPDEAWILWGATARAYQLLVQRTPGQDDKYIQERRAEAARAFSAKSAIWQPYAARKATLQTPTSVNRWTTYTFDPFN